MSTTTTIEWTDATWNPVTGCTKVSAGCDHCYAATFAERFRGTPGHYFEHGFDVQLRPDKLDLPLSWRKPRKVFVNSMSDLFHADVPYEYIAEVFGVMAAAGHHTFQVLTKRHARMRALLTDGEFRMQVLEHARRRTDPSTILRWPVPHVWLGVSVEDQHWANIRVPALIDTPAAVRFLSCEPLLGPIDVSQAACTGSLAGYGHGLTRREVHLGSCCRTATACLDWVIVGGESGHGARPMHPDWARSLRDQCQAAGIPLLFKQWGAWSDIRAGGHSIYDYVTDDDRCQIVDVQGQLRGRPWPGWKVQDGTRDAAAMYRYGKHRAGRHLDGRTWDQFPDPSKPAIGAA